MNDYVESLQRESEELKDSLLGMLSPAPILQSVTPPTTTADVYSTFIACEKHFSTVSNSFCFLNLQIQ